MILLTWVVQESATGSDYGLLEIDTVIGE